jgi:hypothetical protein
VALGQPRGGGQRIVALAGERAFGGQPQEALEALTLGIGERRGDSDLLK